MRAKVWGAGSGSPIGGFLLKNMKMQTHLKPGQKGTKRLVAEYGQSLVCVRYRYDQVRWVRLKTSWLSWRKSIIEEKVWPLAPEHGDVDLTALRAACAAAGGSGTTVVKVLNVMVGSVQAALEAKS